MSFFGCFSPMVTRKYTSINFFACNVIQFTYNGFCFGKCSSAMIGRNLALTKMKSCIVSFWYLCMFIARICTFCTSSLISLLMMSFQRISLPPSQKYTIVVGFPSHILTSTNLSTRHSSPSNTFLIFPHCPHQIWPASHVTLSWILSQI